MAARMAEAHPTDRLEQLAGETGWASEVVNSLYQSEYQRLQSDARVRGYIPVLALKRVRDALKKYERATSARTSRH